jgi:hypothetical protein
MSDLFTCHDCGETYDPKGSPHDCPGTSRELSERIDLLEKELHDLERDHKALLRALLAFSESEAYPRLRALIEMLMRDE